MVNAVRLRDKVFFIICLALILAESAWSMILVPMDNSQTNHLKAYGVVYSSIESGNKVFWLLNYMGGAFVAHRSKSFELQARVAGVSFSIISDSDWNEILSTIEKNNMEKVTLEKTPKIAVYTPPGKLPWDDAVTMALTYAQIPYDKIYDKEVVSGKIKDYDWLHLHHEDFTGQYSKFYRSFSTASWYQKQKMEQESLAKSLGFDKVSNCKKAVALSIRKFVENGGFLFAMCSATNTLEIALAALGVDIIDNVYDGDGVDPQYRQKLNFNNCMAFENFEIATDPLSSNFGNIDVNQVNTPLRKDAKNFELFEFSAKLDPVPSMLVQCHTSTIKGYLGLLTSFNRKVVKKSVIILGQVPNSDMVN
ncbi:MAG: hypothetical protein Q4F84_01090, partial [Fibrobacter sp.]|nr:hypothetical protein [Fibrobacter sp.]